MPPTSINVAGKTATQLLQEARTLLEDTPIAGITPVDEARIRLVTAQWLIAEADYRRVAALVEPGRPLDPDDIDPEAVRRAARATALRKPLPTTADTTIADVCPSRFLHLEDQRIVHCDGRLHRGGGVKHSMDHSRGGLLWRDAGAMPAEQPCDKRCARCVERARDAVLSAAIAYEGSGGRMDDEDALLDAVRAYGKVMGL